MAKGVYIGVNGVARKVKQPYIGAKNFEEVSLPDGYTQVEYIESTGTQYIDTGVSGSGDLEFEIDFKTNSQVSTTDFGDIFGVVGSGQFRLGTYPDATGGGFFYNSTLYDPSLVTGERFKISLKNGVLTINGNTQTVASQTFSVGKNIFVFCGNHRGTANQFSKTILYSFTMSVGGTLVRNFIPCTNADGTAGLYDFVNGVFYANAGSETFAVGSELRNVARKVKKGYVGVAGVARQFFASGIPISNYAVGDIVKLNVNGTPTEFIIVHIGSPSEKYAGDSDGVWLMMKDIYIKKAFDSTDNDYANSDIHAYLNGTFFALLDSDVQSIINTVKIPYNKGNTSAYPDNVQTGENGLSAKVFLLSDTEMNTTDQYDICDDSTVLEYFSSCIADDPEQERAANYNGVATDWWTRTPYKNNSQQVIAVDGTIGRGYYGSCTISKGVRPALVLPYTALVSDDLLITG